MSRIRNLTRHDVNVTAWDDDAELGLIRRTVTIPPEPRPAYVRFEDRVGFSVDTGDGWMSDVVVRTYFELDGVPPQVPFVYLVVATPVAAHPDLVGRSDILVPHQVQKDRAGRIIGCDAFKPGPGVPR